MSKPIPEYVARRERAKALYQQGTRTAKIAEVCSVKHATVRTWASRYGWRASVDALKADLRISGGEVQAVSQADQIAKDSLDTQSSLARSLAEVADLVQTLPLASTERAAQSRGRVLTVIADAARKVHGWEHAKPQVRVSVGLRMSRLPSGKQLRAAMDAACGEPARVAAGPTIDVPNSADGRVPAGPPVPDVDPRCQMATES